MFFKILGSILLATLILSCGSSNVSSGKRSIQLGEYLVGWNDVLAPNSALRQIHAHVVSDLGASESVYLFSAHKPSDLARSDNRPFVTLSDGSKFYGTLKQCETKLMRVGGKTPRQKEFDLYHDCRAKVAKMPRAPKPAPKPRELGFDALISMAERAVRAEGSCHWLGYDRALDARIRAGGSLASLSDERLFFAKLRCN